MQGASKTESHSSDQHNPLNFSNEQSRELYNSTINENTYIDTNNYRMMSELPSQNILPLNITVDEVDRYAFEPQPICEKVSRSLLVVERNQEQQVSFRGLRGKRVILTHEQIHELMDRKRSIIFEKVLYCWQILQTVVKKLCEKYYDFQPLSVRVDTFTLTVVQKNQEKIINQQKLQTLLDYREVSLGRIARKKQFNRALDEAKKKKKDEQVIEVLSPDQQDIVETIDKSKTVASFKEKISCHYPQLIGQLILLTYTDFMLVSNSMRISELPQLVIQIYQIKKQYIDPTFLKQQITCPFSTKKQYSIVREELVNGEMEEIQVSQSKVWGKLALKIVGDVLVERYSGGVLSYFMGDRVRQLPLITLGGAQVNQNKLKLSFQLKDGPEVCEYTFDNQQTLKQIMTNILIITRNYNHVVQLLE